MYYIHNGWRFLLADAFPLKEALENWKENYERMQERTYIF